MIAQKKSRYSFEYLPLMQVRLCSVEPTYRATAQRGVCASDEGHDHCVYKTCKPSVSCAGVHSSCNNRSNGNARNDGVASDEEQFVSTVDHSACVDEVGVLNPEQQHNADNVEEHVDSDCSPFGKVFHTVVLAECSGYHVEDEEQGNVLHVRYNTYETECSDVECPDTEVNNCNCPQEVKQRRRT